MIKVQYPGITSGSNVWHVSIRSKKGTNVSLITENNHLNKFMITDKKVCEYFLVETTKDIDLERFKKFEKESSKLLTGFSLYQEKEFTYIKCLNSIEGLGVLKELDNQSVIFVKEKIKNNNNFFKGIISFKRKDKRELGFNEGR